MIWTFPGKHQGININDVPTDYLNWIVENSKNQLARDAAHKALTYRTSQQQQPNQYNDPRQYQQPQQEYTQTNLPPPQQQMVQSVIAPEDTAEMQIRGLILIGALLADPKNPWKFVPILTKYVVFNEYPSLHQQAPLPKPEPHLSDPEKQFNPVEADKTTENPFVQEEKETPF